MNSFLSDLLSSIDKSMIITMILGVIIIMLCGYLYFQNSNTIDKFSTLSEELEIIKSNIDNLNEHNELNKQQQNMVQQLIKNTSKIMQTQQLPQVSQPQVSIQVPQPQVQQQVPQQQVSQPQVQQQVSQVVQKREQPREQGRKSDVVVDDYSSQFGDDDIKLI